MVVVVAVGTEANLQGCLRAMHTSHSEAVAPIAKGLGAGGRSGTSFTLLLLPPPPPSPREPAVLAALIAIVVL